MICTQGSHQKISEEWRTPLNRVPLYVAKHNYSHSFANYSSQFCSPKFVEAYYIDLYSRSALQL